MADPAKPTAEIGSRIKNVRERLGMSREEAAQKAGVGYQTIYALERGENERVTLDRLYSLAAAWEIDPSELDARFAASSISNPSPVERGTDRPPCPSTVTLRANNSGSPLWMPEGDGDRDCLRGLPLVSGIVIPGLDPLSLKARGVRRLVLEME